MDIPRNNCIMISCNFHQAYAYHIKYRTNRLMVTTHTLIKISNDNYDNGK